MPGTCPECGYNLPYHDSRCTNASPRTPYCPEHAPAGARKSGSDDMKSTCATCGRHGYHVKMYEV